MSELNTLSYTFDWPIEHWINEVNPEEYAVGVIRHYNQELNELLDQASKWSTASTHNPNHNVIQVTIFMEFTPEILTYMLIKYPQQRKIINIGD